MNRTLENELSNIRSVVALNQENESNSWKWAFQHSISPCPEPRKRIELLKMSFPTFDQSLPWTKKTNRTLENEFSNTRSVLALNQENESNSWKWAFQHLISRNARWFRATTDRMLESSFSRVRFVFLVQGKDWSNVGKLIFKSSIRFLGSGQRLIECWKAHFQEFDSFSWFRATTDRMLESSFSRVRFVYLVQGKDCSNVGKLIFKSSIRFLGSGQGLIERWKAHFQEFDSFSWFRARTDRALESSFSRVRFVFLVQGNDFKATSDRMLESSFSRVRFVFLVQGNDWSNVGKLIFKSSIRFLGSIGKLIFKSSIRFLGSGQRLIECWKAHFQEFDSFLGSGQRLIECWKAHFQEFDSFSWFRTTTDRMLESSFSRVRFVFLVRLESSFSRVRFVYLVQGNDWSNVGKLIFKSSIRFLGSRQRLIECWKARFQEFDSFTWFRATTDRALESSFSRVRFVFLVQGNDWLNVKRLVFKSSIRLLGSGQRQIECWKARFQEFDSFLGLGQRLIECWKARFQEFNSFSWFRATTDRMLESSFQKFDSFSWFRATTDRVLENSFSRVRFVFLVQGNDWSNVGKLVFKSSIRFLGSGQRLIECWKARFQEFDSFSWFRARTDRVLESSFSRVQFV